MKANLLINTLFIYLGIINAVAQSGTLDTTFGTSGKVTTSLSTTNITSDIIYSTIIQPDGKILTAGTSLETARYKFALARYLTNGNLDTTFGTAGIVITDIGVITSGGITVEMKLQLDGKIVVIGTHQDTQNDLSKIALVRYNSNGTLDASFGTNGVVFSNFNNYDNEGNGLFIQANGKILAATFAFSSNNNNESNYNIFRYNSNGILDNSFGINGVVSINLGLNIVNLNSSDVATIIIELANGKILVAGKSDSMPTNGENNFAIIQLNSNGTLDTSFGTMGKVFIDFSLDDQVAAMQITATNKIILGGTLFYNSGANSKIGIVQLNANGTIDTTFGTAGKIITTINSSTNNDVLEDLQLQANGDIIVGGTTQNSNTLIGLDFALVKYFINGNLDTNFGTNGFAITDFNNSTEFINSIAIQSNNKIIATGSFAVSNSKFALARYNNVTLSNTTFNQNISAISVYPNPVINTSVIEFNLLQNENITMTLYDTSGKKVQTVVNNKYFALGKNSENFKILNTLPSGIYTLVLSNGNNYKSIKIIL